jgi:hypothetical protein
MIFGLFDGAHGGAPVSLSEENGDQQSRGDRNSGSGGNLTPKDLANRKKGALRNRCRFLQLLGGDKQKLLAGRRYFGQKIARSKYALAEGGTARVTVYGVT